MKSNLYNYANELFKLFVLITFFFASTPSLMFSQSIVLVDFGSNHSGNIFGLTGWDQVLLGPEMNYTNAGPGGVFLSSNYDEYTDYMGILGANRNFVIGERIVVTWYNNSDNIIRFTSRVSFRDMDRPSGGTSEGKWYTMRRFDDYRYTYSEIAPYSTAKTVFNIKNSGVHKTDSSYSLVNISLAIEWGANELKQFLVCDKIELFNDADITPPNAPTNLNAVSISDSKIHLTWDEPTDNVGVVEYLIYRDGEIEGYSRTNSYTAVLLEHSTSYTFKVTALDRCGNESNFSSSVTAVTHIYNGGNNHINPAGFQYLGAILTNENFSYGCEALDYRIDGDSLGPMDGFPGSLFITNVNQPENGFVGEINIPVPVISLTKDINELNETTILQDPVNIRPDNINNWSYVDIWRTGLEYIPSTSRLYSSWSYHFTVSGEKNATISFCGAQNLGSSVKYGAWFIGSPDSLPNDAMNNDYLFSIPIQWADSFTNGRTLVTGRCRDGGLSGLGPTMYAFQPILTFPPPAPNTILPFTTLLEYGSVVGTDGYNFPNSITGYRLCDSWREALWISVEDQNSVMCVGIKALGFHWYGYHGERMRQEWIIADVPYPDFFETDPNDKGWRAHNYQPMAIFYKPEDLAKVATGVLQSYEPQPYSALRFNKSIFWGTMQEIVSAAYDAQNNFLYVAELCPNLDGRVLIHVWKVNKVVVGVEGSQLRNYEFNLEQNFPNPFNSKTVISFQLPRSANVSLKVFDVLGREIAILIDEFKTAGKHQVEFLIETHGKVSDLSSGIYFYQLRDGNFIQTRKMVLVK